MNDTPIGTVRIRIVEEWLHVAPIGRPDDWRLIPLGALDSWCRRQWQERALDPLTTTKGKE